MIDGHHGRGFEREFLWLAAWWLACRLQIMGGEVAGKNVPSGDLAFSLLGWHDMAAEMRLLCGEERGKRETKTR